MTPAAELRAAASKLRELAQRATPGPWRLGNWAALVADRKHPDRMVGWFDQDMVVRVFTRPDPHADLIEQLRDLLGSLPESEIERVIEAAKAAKPGGAS